LNTLAITSSEIFYFNKTQTIDNEFNFIVKEISIKTDYVAILFINYYDNNQRIYKIHNFTINVNDSLDFSLKLILVGIGVVILIILIIMMIYYLVKMKKKNKELEERVNSISFGVEDTNTELSDDDDLNNRKVSYV